MSNSLSNVDLGGSCQLWLNPDLYEYLFVRKFNGARRSSSSTGGFLSLTQLQASNPVAAIEETIPTPQIDDTLSQNPTETRIQQRSTLCLLANSNEALQQAHRYLIDHAQRLAQTGPDARTAWDSIVPLLISPALPTAAVPAATSHVSRHSSFAYDSDVNDVIVIDDADNDNDDEPGEAPSSQVTQPEFSYDVKVAAVSGAEGSTSSAVEVNSSTSVSSIGFTSSSVAPIGISLTDSEPAVFPPASKSPSGSDNANNNRNCAEPSTSAVDATASLASISSKAGPSPMTPLARVLRSQSKGAPSSVAELHNSSIASSTKSKSSTASTSHASRAALSSRSDTLCAAAAQEDSDDDSFQSADCSIWLHSMKQPAVSHVGLVSPGALVLSSDCTQFFGLATISKRERVKPGGRRSSEGKQPDEKHSVTKAKAKAKGKARTPVKGAALRRSRSASSKSAQSDEEKLPAPNRLVPCWQKINCPHKKPKRYRFCPACYKRREQWKKQLARQRASPIHSKSIAAPNIKLEGACCFRLLCSDLRLVQILQYTRTFQIFALFRFFCFASLAFNFFEELQTSPERSPTAE